MIVNLSWNPVPNALTYNVYRNGGPSGFQLIFTTLTATNYVDGPNDLDPSTTYRYQITAVNGNGESLPSNIVTAAPSPAPGMPAAFLTISGGAPPLLPTPTAFFPIVSLQVGGGLPGNPDSYYTRISWIDPWGGVSAAGHAALNGMGSPAFGSLLIQPNPTEVIPPTAIGYNIYMALWPAGLNHETLQTTVIGFGPYLQATPLVSGVAAPTVPLQGVYP